MGNTVTPAPSAPPLQPPLSFDHFSLPALSVSAANDLRLTYSNTAAARLLHLPSGSSASATAIDFLCEAADHDVQRKRALVLQQLSALATAYAERTEDSFGEGALLQYWTGPAGKRTSRLAEVACISSTASDSFSDLGSAKDATYSLLFLRSGSHYGDGTHPSLLRTSSDLSSTASASQGEHGIPRSKIRHLFPKENDVSLHYKTIFQRVEERTAETAQQGGGLDLPETELVRLLDELPQICFVATPEGSTEFWNRMWFEYTGCGSDPQTWISAFHPDDLPGELALFFAVALILTRLALQAPSLIGKVRS